MPEKWTENEERYINRELLDFLERLDLISDRQYGLRYQRSTEDLLAYICRWVADFLSGRKISVVIDGISSSSCKIGLGSDTVFLHINDLLSCTINPIHSFADDSTLHSGIQSDKDLEAITAWGRHNFVRSNAPKYSTVP
ncbi:unnamed protein product [Acanthoscelides obtectus]|uniref:Uncharacterized protein n=1 Tax=Acanthoscelides obtectus TaxID=200917 RepID=A0A9P0MKL2_ACAOB|nr:unnamed protein product [Acanthoscelides obtectus]CAK1652196.1 hypothetical protein AOBTE_LOCUS17729 [Acanthoscelides obtectus]